LFVSCLVKSITVSSVATVATKQGAKGNTEQWEDEGSKDKDEKSEDDGFWMEVALKVMEVVPSLPTAM